MAPPSAFSLNAGRKPVQGSTAEMGVDVRGDGGYVVAPPSVHPNGNRYEFEDYLDDVPIARADSNVYAFIRAVQGERQRGKRFSLPEVIADGKRNDTLMRLACSLQAQGFDDATMLASLEAANRLKLNAGRKPVQGSTSCPGRLSRI